MVLSDDSLGGFGADRLLRAPTARGPSPQEEDFLARMSHELRTPLNAIQGYTDLLMESKAPDDEDLHDLRAIRRATRRLLGFVESVLDLNQLRSGRFQVECHRFRIQQVVDEVVDAVRDQAERSKTEIRTTIEDLELNTDPRMVRQILFNLAHNACRFTMKGTVDIAIRDLGESFEIVVRDDGIGMTARQVEAATEPFWQADATTTRKYDGAGLGLAVCAGLAEAMGGSMLIESAMGRGATVTVVLPTEAESESDDWEFDDEPTVYLR